MTGYELINMETWMVKTISAVILFALSLGFGLSPLFCLRRYIINPSSGKAKAALGFASCIAAGVFLAVCLLDLLPDVQESLTKGLRELNMSVSFPLAELIMACGLFFILTVELSVSMCSPDFTEMMHSHGGGGGHGHSHGNGHGHSHNVNQISGAEIQVIVAEESDDEVIDDTPSRHHSRRRHHSSECEHGVLLCSSPPNMRFFPDAATEESPLLHRTPSVHSLPPIHLEDKTLIEVTADAGLSTFDKPFRAIILLVALSIHSLFEGLSIGAAQDQAVVIQLALALAIHKPLESLGVCLSLIRSSKTQSFVVKLVILFSITCPLGVGIGMGVLGLLTSGVSDLVTGILQGLAGGSFLYVVFIEVLPHEFVDVLEEPPAPLQPMEIDASQRSVVAIKEGKRIRTLKMFKLLGLLLGFSLITVTKLFLPEDDDGAHPC